MTGLEDPEADSLPTSDTEVDRKPGVRRRRRVSQRAPEGSDPHPFDPPVEPRSSGENDERLRADRPPHWG